MELVQAKVLPFRATFTHARLHIATATVSLGAGIAHPLRGVDGWWPRQIDLGKQQIADLFAGMLQIPLLQCLAQFGDLLSDLVQNPMGIRPVKPDPRRTALQLGGTAQSRQADRNFIQHTAARFGSAFLLLDRLPVTVDLFDGYSIKDRKSTRL